MCVMRLALDIGASLEGCNMETIIVICAIIIMVVGGSVVGIMLKRRSAFQSMENDVKMWIEEYKSKLTGSNRFLLNEDVLLKAFPEYDQKTVRKVWTQLVVNRIVDRDPLDGEMCIR